MPEAPVHDDQTLVIESVTWLDGSPVPQARRLSAAGLRGKLGQPGMIALAEGAALICCFFFPWFSMLTLTSGNGPGRFAPVSYSGWSIARGMPFFVEGGPIRIALFVHLWLVPLTAVALLVIAWLCGQRRLSYHLASGAILALSALALLVELGYYVQVSSLGSVMANNPGANSPIGVLWGCWLAVGVNAVALAVSANSIKPYRALPTAEGEADGSDG
jgi:hypothetical protein